MHTVKTLVLLMVCGLLLCGCSGKSKAAQENQEADYFVEYSGSDFSGRIDTLAMGDLVAYRSPAGKRSRYSYKNHKSYESGNPGSRRQLLRAARSAIGTPYVVGGSSPGGFDCSGLVCWAYGNVGVKLPRTAREQSVVGTKVRSVEDMQAGDIVAFRHPKRGYHTGIYVGDGKFIHSPRRKSRVRINSLDDPYFSETFLGARRINLNGRENLLAQAENRLRDEYAFSPVRFRAREDGSRSSRNASREMSRNKRLSIAEYRSGRLSDKDMKKRRGRDGRRELADASSSRRSAKNDRHASRAKNREVASNSRRHVNDRKRDVSSSKNKHDKHARSNKHDRGRESAMNKRQEKRSRSDKKKSSRKS